ncbi:MAG: hypothetical protein IT447_07635 [Phycisphaerales bacterium]|nr:hypothetical protein [Phycisphaerales bacterium]
MSKRYLPDSDGGLRDWAANFNTLIVADPTAYGLTAAQALEYGGKFDAYNTALTAAKDPSTRGLATVLAKNIARKALVALSRQLAQFIRNNPVITDPQRLALGLSINTRHSPIPAPAEAPRMDVRAVSGQTFTLQLHSQGNGRGKPAGVSGARFYSFVGETAPQDLRDWTFEGTDSRTRLDLTLSAPTPPGSRVWLCACWLNPRQQCGPACEPASAHVQYGPPVMTSTDREDGMQINRAA